MTLNNEFPHLVPAVRVGPDAHKITFGANEKQRAALAKRFAILSVESFEGNASLRRQSDGMTIHVTGDFEARVTQACVTTLEPVQDYIAEEFEGWFLDESQATSFVRAKKRLNPEDDLTSMDLPSLEDEETAMASETEDPEPVVGGVIDIGELATQYLSLALNPYPHSDEALESGPLGDDTAPEKESPFAALKDWKAE